MASLMELLLDTMPFAALDETLRREHQIADGMREAPADLISNYATYYPPGAALQPMPDYLWKIGAQTKTRYASTGEAGARAKWIWSMDPRVASSGTPEFTDLTCRVRSVDYAEHVVAERVRFGRLVGDAYVDAVAIKTNESKPRTVSLPLRPPFLYAQWLVRGPGLLADESALWPLAANIDLSFLQVYVYDLLPGDATPHPLDVARMTPSDAEGITRARAGYEEIHHDAVAVGADNWLFEDAEFFPERTLSDTHEATAAAAAGALGGIFATAGAKTTTLALAPKRIVVVCMVTLNGETADFEPAGLVDVARMYPCIMVNATFSLKQVDASVFIDRPAKTTLRSGHAHCCEMHEAIGSVLVTDTNSGAERLPYAPVPFWDSMFNYYEPAPFARFGSRDLHMVRRGGRFGRTRENDDGWVVREVGYDPILGPFGTSVTEPVTRTNVLKVAGQGAFDNVHIAPKMHLLEAVQIGGQKISSHAAYALDEITMAPFCAHDCLHFHWRWSDAFQLHRGTHGFDERNRPHAKAGAVMVPKNQEVDLRLVAPHRIVYTARVRDCAARQWQPIMHHGGAFGVDASGLMATVARYGIDMLARQPQVVLKDGRTLVSAADSWSLFYWKLRYRFALDGTFEECSKIVDLEKAMDL